MLFPKGPLASQWPRPVQSGVTMNRRLFLRTAGLASLACMTGCASGRIDVSKYKGPIKVACVGDSITYGAGVEDREKNSYPRVLGQLLGERFDVWNFGVNGATLLAHGDNPWRFTPQFNAALGLRPDVVVIKLGTNDSKPQNWIRSIRFEDDLEALIDDFKGLPSRPKIFLCLPVPAYEVRWGINEATINGGVIPAIRAVAKRCRLQVIDLHSALAGQAALFPDRIHPDARGARLIAETVKASLLGIPK